MALVTFLVVAIVLLAQAVQDSDRPRDAAVWGGLALAAYVCALMCAVGLATGTYDTLGFKAWRLGPWLLAWYAIAYGVATTTWQHAQPIASSASEISVGSVLKALWLTGVGITCWAAGYLVGPGWIATSRGRAGVAALRRRFSDEVRSPLAPWILYGIGTAARVADALTTGRFGYSGQTAAAVTSAGGFDEVLGVLSYLPVCAVLAAALQVFCEGRRSARFTLWMLVLAELAIASVSGDKSNFINLLVAVAIPYAAARRHLPRVAIALAAVLLLIIVIPFTAAYRGIIDSKRSVLTAHESVAAAPAVLREMLNLRDTVGALPTSFDYLLARIQEIDSVAIIVQRTPSQIPYESPAALAEIPLEGFVPRLIWPNKPLHLSMQEVSEEYYDIPPSANNAAAVTPIGELFRYGGWWVTIIGMTIFGAWVRFLDDVLDAKGNSHAGIFLVMIFWTVVVEEAGWINIFASIPLTAALWALFVALTFRRRRVS